MNQAEKQVVVGSFHGVKVADPYRWLEDDGTPQVKEWVRNQNETTQAYLEQIPFREQVRSRLRALWNYPKYFAPDKTAGQYFFQEDDGARDQPLFYVQSTTGGERRVLLDPNTMSDDGTVALSTTSVSKNGKWLAYAISTHGSDRQEIRVLDVQTREHTSDLIRWCKFTNIAWHPNGQGFYYSRFPEPGSVPEEDLSNYCQVYFHRLGTEQSEDCLVYERLDAKELGFHPHITDDGRYLCLTVTQGSSGVHRFYVRELNSDGPFERLFDHGDAMYVMVGNVGETFYFVTNHSAPKRKVVAVDIRRPSPDDWTTVVDESADVIASASFIHNQLVLVMMKDAHHDLRIHDLDGRHVDTPALPALGTITQVKGGHDDDEMFVGFTSYLVPQSVLRYDFATSTLEPYWVPDIDFDASRYETRQVFFTSTDGTRVPMFVTHRKGLELDGQRPTLMYGYGGFNLSQTPQFYPAHLMLMEQGGVFAVVTLRGGSEYGEEWHRAGMLGNKQNVFDDFHSAAEYLCKEGYTSPDRLAIQGRSNGGLLVSATMLQRPDLYGAVVCQVPVTDMLRYHKFTVGRYWVPEYGHAERDPEHFRFMYAYSPLHNVVHGRVYPPILITTGDSDDRVVPMHSYKLAATLQAASPKVNPVLLRVDINAGHGLGKPVSKLVEEWADIYTFVFDALGVAL